MAYGSGLSAQIGYGVETVWGTRVAPTRFLEFLDESMKLNIDRIESSGLRAGTAVQRSDRWAVGPRDVGGSVTHELQNKGLGLLFEHCLGAIATSGSAPVFEHKATLDDPTGLGLTMQIGRPSADATVRPFDYAGAKVTGFKLSGEVGQIGRFALDYLAQDEDTTETLATASYASDLEVLYWTGTSMTLDAVAFDCRKIDIDVKHGFKGDRFKLGSATRKEPIRNAFTEIELMLDTEFLDMDAYNAFVNGTPAAVVCTFDGSVIPTGAGETFQVEVNLPYVRFDGETPNVSGPDVLSLPIKAKALDDGSADAPIAITYRTNDATP